MIAKRIILILISLFVRCSFDKYAYRNNKFVWYKIKEITCEKKKKNKCESEKKKNKCIGSRVVRLQTRHSLFFFFFFSLHFLTLRSSTTSPGRSFLFSYESNSPLLICFYRFERFRLYRIYIHVYRSSNEFLFFAPLPSPLLNIFTHLFSTLTQFERNNFFSEKRERKRERVTKGKMIWFLRSWAVWTIHE